MTERPFTTPADPVTDPLSSTWSTTTSTDAMTEPSTTSMTTSSSLPSETSDWGSGSDSSQDTKQVAKDEAASVAADAKESGRKVAGTATSEAKDVVAEAGTQVKQLLGQLRSELTDQASGQSTRAVGGLRTLADELRDMSTSTQQSGMASDLARQASDRAQGFADWLDGREPGDLLEEARAFARRRPGAFLAAAAVVGLVGGRLTRGLTSGTNGDSDGQTSRPVAASRVPLATTSTPSTSATFVTPPPVGGFSNLEDSFQDGPYDVNAPTPSASSSYPLDREDGLTGEGPR